MHHKFKKIVKNILKKILYLVKNIFSIVKSYICKKVRNYEKINLYYC